MSDPDAVLVVDEASFDKEGSRFVGAQRHFDGATGRVQHRQVGLFLAYAGASGQAFLDRELFLPRVWTERETLRQATGVPADVGFATKPQMARRMLERAFAAGAPHAWIAGGPSIGSDAELRMWLETGCRRYVMAVSGREAISLGAAQLRVDLITAGWPGESWHEVPVGTSTGGEWARARLDGGGGHGWARWLLARRSSVPGHPHAHYLAYAPMGASLSSLVVAASACDRVRQSLDAARRDVGLDVYTGRSWHGWYRHMSMSLLAHACQTRFRAVRGLAGCARD